MTSAPPFATVGQSTKSYPNKNHSHKPFFLLIAFGIDIKLHTSHYYTSQWGKKGLSKQKKMQMFSVYRQVMNVKYTGR